jgi:hypothetical protein
VSPETPQTDSGRKDYNRLIRFRQVQPGEPIFMLMGRDIVSGPTVRDWAARAHEAGSPPALIESALQQADALDAYPEKKAPDADHLTPEEQTHLAYQLDRRAWSARAVAHSPAILFAERRGYALGRAHDRQAETLLRELYRAAIDAMVAYPAGDASARLQACAAAAGLHLATVKAVTSEAG